MQFYAQLHRHAGRASASKAKTHTSVSGTQTGINRYSKCVESILTDAVCGAQAQAWVLPREHVEAMD